MDFVIYVNNLMMPQSFIIKLYSKTQVSGRLGMSGGISPRQRFYRIRMSLKRPFVPKSDVKQLITTTTACNICYIVNVGNIIKK